MTKKTRFLLLAGSVAAISIFLEATPVIQDEAAETKKPLDISLVSSGDVEIDFAPGEEFDYNFAVKNEGTDPARVFIKAKIPKAEGAVLLDGTKDPEILDYDLGDGWVPVEDDVYFYDEVLEAGETTTGLFARTAIPEYDLEQRDHKIFTGSITIDELNETAKGLSFQGFAIMEMEGTPEQLWGMVE